ncbi:hypothetical protein CsSME_00011397 [Camellia sinensis var. sinensis]
MILRPATLRRQRTDTLSLRVRMMMLARDQRARRALSLVLSQEKEMMILALAQTLGRMCELTLHEARSLAHDGELDVGRRHFVDYRIFVGPPGFLYPFRIWLASLHCVYFDSIYSQCDRTAFLFLFFPSLLFVLRSWLWGGCLSALSVQLYQNILRVNGSDIRPWWIKHHYFTMAMALISLTWETQKGVQLFLQWAIMQGVAMLLQNRYQRQRLCTHITLGKARRMDVVWGETAGVDGQLWLLAPILFILQGFEAYVGILLLKAALAGVVFEWQVVTCGMLLIVMAIGNFANTV